MHFCLERIQEGWVGRSTCPNPIHDQKSPKFGLEGHPGNVPKGSLKGSFG